MNENELKNLIAQGLSTWQISKQINKCQTSVRYWLKKFGLSTKLEKCIVCGKVLTGKKTKYCCNKCKNQGPLGVPRSQQTRGLERRIQLVLSKGGKCEKCGYSSNLACFEFHHLDPSQKDFNLDVRSLSNRSFEKSLSEVEKCQLLCANCHREAHNPRGFNWSPPEKILPE